MLLLIAVTALTCTKPEAPPSEKKKLTIAVIPKGTTHEFWKSVHFGAQTAADELAAEGVAVEILWNGPHNEGDVAGQISIVQDFVTRGVSGLFAYTTPERLKQFGALGPAWVNAKRPDGFRLIED